MGFWTKWGFGRSGIRSGQKQTESDSCHPRKGKHGRLCAGMTKKQDNLSLLLQDGRIRVENAIFHTDRGRFLNQYRVVAISLDV